MATLEREIEPEAAPYAESPTEKEGLINASGHVQELDRQFSLLSLAGVGLINGNVWPALGGSILVSIYNGGPPGNLCVQLYAIHHPDFKVQPWHVFVTYVIVSWLGCLAVCFGHRLLPHLNTLGFTFILSGVLITVITVAAMPGHSNRPPHASSSFVWTDWTASIGYPDGFVFLLGMLNGAYAVGTPDCTTHLAEEVPHPSLNVPKAIALQMAIGFLTGLIYLIAILYSIHNLPALSSSPFPIAEIYHQATGSTAGTTGLLMILFFPILLCVTATFITNGRTLWALARDGATPFPEFFGRVNRTLGMPLNATLACGAVVTLLGCIYVGSTTAFNAIIGSFVIMSSASYAAAILPHLLTSRRNVIPGPFYMRGVWGTVMHAVAVVYIVTFIVIYCFPYALPTDAASMNYSSLIFGGLTILIAAWWVVGPMRNGKYQGPKTIGGPLGEVENMRRVNETTV
ncbi:MAG: hypothetical protein Q9227_000381 [Pyrenula ochraceoflavens]